MASTVKILPSEREFELAKNEPVLEAALRAGLNLDYGCTNGTCGRCKARVLSGNPVRLSHHDYVISEAEKAQGYTLLCCYGANENLVVEASDTTAVEDIPQQQIRARIRRIERVGGDVAVLHLRTPRSSALRFLAGQYVTLSVDGGVAQDCAIGSCPCDSMNLQFHLRDDKTSELARMIRDHLPASAAVLIEGPAGTFTLDEASPRPVVFIAYGLGFAPIKSLLEHTLALEKEQALYLYWLMPAGQPHYLHNFCRSFADAIDNLSYRPLTLPEPAQLRNSIDIVTRHNSDLAQHDVYIAGPRAIAAEISKQLVSAGAKTAQISCTYIEDDGSVQTDT